MLEAAYERTVCTDLEGEYGLWEAPFVAELIHHVIATGDDKRMPWKTHPVDFACVKGISDDLHADI